MAEDRAMRDAAFVLKGMNGFRSGVYPHKKTKAFEVKVTDNRSSSSKRKRDIVWFGYHGCAEAASRIADIATIVMSDWTGEKPDPSMRLNYRLADYDLSYILKLRAMPKHKMIGALRSQAKEDYRECAQGLVAYARDDLKQAIRRWQSEMHEKQRFS